MTKDEFIEWKKKVDSFIHETAEERKKRKESEEKSKEKKKGGFLDFLGDD